MRKTVLSLLLTVMLGISVPSAEVEQAAETSVQEDIFIDGDTDTGAILENELQIEEIEVEDEVQEEEFFMDEQQVTERPSSEENETEESRSEPLEGSEEYGGILFTDEDAQNISGETLEEQQIIEEIENGEIIAIAPAILADLGTEISSKSVGSNEAAAVQLAPDRYRLISTSIIANCDEVWTSNSAIHARVRYIEYVDSNGDTKRAPLYCLKASKMGIDETGPSGIGLKPEAIRFFSDSTIKKLLYFGYGGPGDICGKYDPTCSHVNWSKWQNRYVFTHQALSKIYANDVNGATQSQIEHVGLVRFIKKIKSMTIPNRSAVKIRAMDANGNMVTSNPLNINMICYQTKPSSGFSWMEPTFNDGFQISPLCSVLDQGKAGNGILIKRGMKDSWQLAYWTSENEAIKNPESPRTLKKGEQVQLKNGYCFRMVYSKKYSGVKYFSWKMLLNPVKYILVDGSVQTGMDIQDFGACVYQGSRGLMKLNLAFQPLGLIDLKKTSSHTGRSVKGAVYCLYADQDLYSGGVLMYKKDTKVAEAITNEYGSIRFETLLPGKYYIKEKTAAPGYLLSAEAVPCTVVAAQRTFVPVKNIPDIRGKVLVEKVAEGTGVFLSDAEFTLYEWDQTIGIYKEAGLMVYDPVQRKYIAEELIYDDINQGKFKIVETKNPSGYTGNWSQEIILKDAGTNKLFSYRVENALIKEHRVEIWKQDSLTGSILQGAEFNIYEWDQLLTAYNIQGKLLTYDAGMMVYRSDVLRITDRNQGRYKIVETKNPTGYQGTWMKEINLNEANVQLQFHVKNTPVPKKYGSVSIRKKDQITGIELSGAEFQAYAWNSADGRYQETPESQGFIFSNITRCYLCKNLEITNENKGRFLIRETRNPDGYSGKWEKEIVFDRAGQLLEFDVVNKPERLPVGKITITKKILASEITWAHGNPVFPFVIEGIDAYGNARKYEQSVMFVPGGYAEDGNGNAVISTTVTDIPLGDYRIYEKQVLRYFLERAEAGSRNVSIIATGSPQYGKAPLDTAYGTAVLSKDVPTASITFFNRKKRYDGYSHNSYVENLIPVIREKPLLN